jgi:hypothetical protein
VQRVLESIEASYALIGAYAMAAHGYPRFTVDIDLLTTDMRVLDPAIWTDLEREGSVVDPRRGDADDPLAGVVHIQLADESDVDVIVARWKWEAEVIERAERMTVMGVDLPVPPVSDLILLKLAAGGYLDLHDAAALLMLGERTALIDAVQRHISDVYPDVRALWRDLLASVPPPPN